MSVFVHADRHPVAVLARNGAMPMELGIVHQLLGQARSTEGAPLYEVVTCTPVPGEVRTNADFSIRVAHGPEALAQARTVIVVASHDPDATEADGVLDTVLAAALAWISPGARIASICTGAFVLAAAGLLDGRRATTHWESSDRFRKLFPGIALDPDVLYVDEGDVLTSAGEASGIDLCLHIIRSDHGAAVANDVARATVVPPHRDGGQAQFIRRPVPEPRSSSTGRARAWALENLDRQLSLRALAARESMSVRTFTRNFRQETGLSPVRWLTLRRVERARELLESTDLSVERIAADTGFGSPVSLRQHLHAALGVSPSAYRATFRGTPPEGSRTGT
ncbi:GlxA family transcriptional regulator [Nocardiopsis ansamitocini]|uniref:AraC family transcriptional regulator n=1 Tax=Nocardiopsis ansamitocini TaxID=1670832 RepID=A0A9W6P6K1_9ACTN|nr:helix-turn-helix domain-containing protein [Nocardiopsis ansamitocini]GLU48385.1 AraC family transcriptional regulator [Nocardiopsis ansamitocini]